ncbi:MAG TPA: YicC/YloC family endoribonuclease [Thermoanaerobaculia bacterium]|nr:YicC/YloC family endoribonuclease [Thermoanaerobaculia bacterium]
MTGFAESGQENGRRRIEVVAQGWNHRNLDIVLRLPEELRSREAELRERIARLVRRGRCDLSIRVQTIDPGGARPLVDPNAVRRLHDQVRDLVEEGKVIPTLTLGDLLRSSAALGPDSGAVAWEDGDLAVLENAVGEALAGFARARALEGARLASILEQGRRELLDLVDRLEARRAAVVELQGAAWRSRLEEILANGPDGIPGDRVAQEVAILIERGDVREELDRLRAHLDHFAQAAGGDGAVGKRLDFLAQEILRELNTLGAKSRDSELTRLVVEAKVICEQLREQIQNVE